MDCSPGGGGGGIGISGSACAAGAASVSAAIAPVATVSGQTVSDFFTDAPFAFFTVLLGASVLVLRLLHLCKV